MHMVQERNRVHEEAQSGNEGFGAQVMSLCSPGLRITFKNLIFFSDVQTQTFNSILLTPIYTESGTGFTHFILMVSTAEARVKF